MSDKNIWENLNFTEASTTSAYDLLCTQSEYLDKATNGVLKMQVETIDSLLDGNPPRLAEFYILYVVAPGLGNYRRKILTVAEYADTGKFPVDIVSHIDNSKRIEKVSEDTFLDTIEEILSRPLIQNSIVNLYKQSKGVEA